jgi:alkylation response protein AidB-like acyl-CoA dehydrogenase
MEFQIGLQQREMIASVRDLAQNEFKPNAHRWMDGTFPWENMKKLANLGVLGMSVPEEYGGLGLPILDTALILEEIAKVDYVTAMAVLGEAGVQTRVIARYAPPSIRERILPRVVSGNCILAVCMTEPHAGTDVANYRTNTRVLSDRIVLKGTKTLISRAREAGMFVVFSRIDGKPGREGIGCVLLEPDTKGFEVTGTYHTMGGENLHEIQFNDCELPLENLVIKEDGFRRLLSAFNTQRCLNPSISLGLAEGAFDEAVNYVRERTIFRQANLRFSRYSLEARGHVQRHRSGSRPAVSCLPDRQSIPGPIHGGGRENLLQRDVVAGHDRGRPGAWRIRLHRRIPSVAVLSWRALWFHRRRRVGDVARSDRQKNRWRFRCC